jgi:hypothetical protein
VIEASEGVMAGAFFRSETTSSLPEGDERRLSGHLASLDSGVAGKEGESPVELPVRAAPSRNDEVVPLRRRLERFVRSGVEGQTGLMNWFVKPTGK